jgi:putative aldouronate transport system substrate-binding protein
MKRAVLLAVIAGLVCGTGAWAGGEGEGAAGERVHVTAYWTDGVPPPKGRMLEYINDKFNMDFEIIVQPIAEYAQKLQLDMASGDLADLIQVRGPTTGGARIVRLLIDGGMVQDLTPMLVDYPNLTAYLAQPEASRFSLWDGNNYVVPKRYFHHTTGFYYRKDLLDKYNQPIPETVEQFGEVLKVVHEGEGIPGYVSFGLYFGNHYFFGAHTDLGMDHPAWKWKDGRYVDLSISDEWKEGLRIIRQFYADGVLDPEFVILTDFGKFREKFTTGKVAAIPVHVEANYFYDEMVGLTEKSIPGADVFVAFPPMGSVGPHNNRPVSPFGTVDMLVATTADHPDRILALWDFLFSEEGDLFNFYGIEGVHWSRDSDGNIVTNREELAKDTGSESDPISKWRWFSNIMPDWIPDYSIEKERQEELIAWGQRYGVSPYVIGFVSETFQRVAPELSKIRDEFYTKFILGELDVDANWDEFVTTYRKAGYDTLEEEVQEYCRADVSGKCRK